MLQFSSFYLNSNLFCSINVGFICTFILNISTDLRSKYRWSTIVLMMVQMLTGGENITWACLYAYEHLCKHNLHKLSVWESSPIHSVLLSYNSAVVSTRLLTRFIFVFFMGIFVYVRVCEESNPQNIVHTLIYSNDIVWQVSREKWRRLFHMHNQIKRFHNETNAKTQNTEN